MSHSAAAPVPEPLADAPVAALREAVLRAAARLGGTPKSTPTLERPKQVGHGDYATNAAMLLSGALKRPPRDIAEALAAALQADLGDQLAAVEVAGPGFLNLTLGDAWYQAALAGVLDAGDGFGAGRPATALKVDVEFVSANPTGPLHIGGARNAAYGDALARILAKAGHDVTREYYVNDFGSQITILGESVRLRARGEDVPEGMYVGDYVQAIADAIPGAEGLSAEELAPRAVVLVMEQVRGSLERFGVHMDVWFSERSLHERGLVEHAFEVLEGQGRSYRSEGALWLRTEDLGDDRPGRVMERSSGEHTYFASDIAYHQEKRERGFDLLIDVWGADHHGYVARLKAAFQALGGDPEGLELVIMQLVHLVKDGEPFKMSKRAGDFVTLDDLLGEIGPDAARWFLLQRSHDTTIDLDLGLAARQDRENPVYYVQYAHARASRVLERVSAAPAAAVLPPNGLHPSERALVKLLLALPAEVEEAAARRAPHRIATYVLEVAQAFSAFYRDCKVLDDPAEAFRAAITKATQHVLATALDLLGVRAPTSMGPREDAEL